MDSYFLSCCSCQLNDTRMCPVTVSCLTEQTHQDKNLEVTADVLILCLKLSLSLLCVCDKC